MRFRLFFCWVVAGLLGLPAGGHAQSWQRDPVLSQSLVKALVYDHTGFMWVGTDAGVFRYDGYALTPLGALCRSGATTLLAKSVTGLVVDSAGTLWVGNEAGLFRFSSATGQLRRVLLPGSSPQHADVSLLWLHPRTRQLWVGYERGKLLSLSTASQPVAAGHAYQFPLSVRWLADDARGQYLWAVTDGGHIYQVGPARITAVAGWPGRYLLPVPGTRPQQFVSTHALYVQDSATATLHEQQRWDTTGLEGGFQPLLRAHAWELAYQRQSVALHWPGSGGYPTVVRSPAVAALSSSTSLLYTVQATADGLRWAYSPGQRGCYKRRPQTSFLAPLSGRAGETYSTRAIIRLPDGQLLAGGYGPALLQAADSPLAALRPLLPSPHALHRVLYGLLAVGQRVFYAEENHGFGEFHPATGQLTPFRLLPAGDNATLRAQALLHDQRGRLWGGTQHGLYLLDAAAGQLRLYTHGVGAQLAQYDIRALAEAPDGHLWVATEQGLHEVALDAGTIRTYDTSQPAPYRLPSNDILCLYLTPTGAVWAGTRDQGLLLLKPGRSVQQQYTATTGLPSPTVVTLLPGQHDDVWAGTYAGLVQVQPDQHNCRVYTAANGLRELEFNRQAAWRDTDGTLYFGGVGGIYRVVPARVPAAPAAPHLLLTSIIHYLPGASPAGHTEPVAASYQEVLHLPPGTAYVAWQLTLSDYLHPDGSRFQCQLLDEAGQVHWQTNSAHTLLLPAPPPGRYVLRVTGETEQGIRANNSLALTLVVERVWWQHPLVIGLVAGLLVSAGYALQRRRLAQALRELQLRTRIAADLHDEVGTLLTRVTVQAELLPGLPSEEQAWALERLLRNSRAAASTMRDVVWGIDARSDSAGSLLDRMREYLHQTAGAAGWHTELGATGWPDTTLLPPAVRQAVYRVFKEAVTNAVRHAHQATYLQVRLSRRADWLVLYVADDGRPLPTPAAATTGMGLLNMQQRAAELGGRVTAGPGPAGGFYLQWEVPVPLRWPRLLRRR
ncbi:MAG: sensor histidine kinase [Janthinobacterium lividum]